MTINSEMQHIYQIFILLQTRNLSIELLNFNTKNNVYNFGHLSLNNLKYKQYISKTEIKKKFNINFSKKNLLITFHPLTTENNKTKKFY